MKIISSPLGVISFVICFIFVVTALYLFFLAEANYQVPAYERVVLRVGEYTVRLLHTILQLKVSLRSQPFSSFSVLLMTTIITPT